jgi:membrane-bound lytic murein transglycosylase D
MADLRELNPELRTPMTPPVPKYTIRVPQGHGEDALAFINNPDADPARYKTYNARAGENVAHVARNHKVNTNHLKRLNNLALDTVYVNKILFIPNGEFGQIDEAFAGEIAALAPQYYTVRRGDTLSDISRKHNMPLQHLLRLNPKLNTRRNIYPGQVIVVSQGGFRGS